MVSSDGPAFRRRVALSKVCHALDCSVAWAAVSDTFQSIIRQHTNLQPQRNVNHNLWLAQARGTERASAAFSNQPEPVTGQSASCLA